MGNLITEPLRFIEETSLPGQPEPRFSVNFIKSVLDAQRFLNLPDTLVERGPKLIVKNAQFAFIGSPN